MKTRIPRRLGNCANGDGDGAVIELFAMVVRWLEITSLIRCSCGGLGSRLYWIWQADFLAHEWD